jgi:hypothetical protein
MNSSRWPRSSFVGCRGKSKNSWKVGDADPNLRKARKVSGTFVGKLGAANQGGELCAGQRTLIFALRVLLLGVLNALRFLSS